MKTYEIRKLKANELKDAINLVWETFLEFEAPNYLAEGVTEFKNFINLSSMMQMQAKSHLFFWGCFDESKIIGVIATKPTCHLSLLFVDKRYHHKGIARALISDVLDDYKKNTSWSVLTVNSSLYAVDFYHRLGFVDTNVQQEKNGIRFVPMKHVFR